MMAGNAGENSPHLDEREQEQAAERAHVGPRVIHEVVREQGEKEISRPTSSLAWSGLAAGLSIGFSAVAEAYLEAGLPEAPWARLVQAFGYSLGFLIVVLGQQQLYTEITLTAMIPTLTQRTWSTALQTVRVFGVVLGCNLVGTFIFAFFSAYPGVFSPGAYAAMGKLSADTMAHPFWHTVAAGGAAGWLIGLMVWLLPGAGPSRPLIIILLTYVVAMCQFPHIVAGSVEAAFGVFAGQASVGDYVFGFLVPTFLGNSIGGIVLVALLNHAPVAGEMGLGTGRKAG
ncbi:MAG: formate/nitrite transporter family protein [Gluconacetobacter diazotrophicus]|nr:formate/nitrite transporter family protein [Gluconacetobacter diazotrophicus]